MAEVIGFLREDATHGEKQTLKLLSRNLPKEFSVYVESPIHKKRDIRYPDFVVVTNYGVIVLEVKDWVTVVNANPGGATVRDRKGKERFEPNPVTKAREFAITLSHELNRTLNGHGGGESIPWSYAALLANLPYSVITQLRTPWGEEFVLGEDDLIVPDLLLKRLKMTFPAERMRPLLKNELDLVRATIYPAVEIEIPGRASFVLDEQQEKIVAEPVDRGNKKEERRKVEVRQDALFESLASPEPEEEVSEADEKLARNTAIRLVRGFAGSGKSLVLIQRAKFLAAQYPDWKIGVFTFNKQLQEELTSAFTGTRIKPQTFHGICMSMLPQPRDPVKMETWLDGSRLDYDIIRRLGVPATKLEIEWIWDMGLACREEYLKIERRGIGKELRLNKESRSQVYDVLEAYQAYLAENRSWDFDHLPVLVEQELAAGRIAAPCYDAVLIDEAQDWAPNWIRIVNRLVHPEHGLVFLADDPSQSIYRSFSWKEKGIPVAGRTRWLKIPYRNTREIYEAAYGMIADHDEIQRSLTEEGELVTPDLSTAAMRHGPRPLVQRCMSVEKELDLLKNKIFSLRQEGYRDKQVVILVRYSQRIRGIRERLRGIDVRVQPIHGFKGLEAEVVFIPHLQQTFLKEDQEDIAAERRILYMAMSRAREKLYMTYFGKLPRPYEDLRRQGLADFVG
ncbi:MAG TPA: UvrD-helicase domain-containing protein [Anaerolineales bacterium]|nr:UvrD-helicase domain-containing protein [Anaerolineales bacterium]